MKIIVLMKRVANKDAVLRVAADEKWINETDVAHQTNESDGYALEEALRLKEATTPASQSLGHPSSNQEGSLCEVVVCSLGPQSAKTVIKDALARGADRAIHVVYDQPNQLSPHQIARAIADAIADEKADLVFTGLQSDDASYGQTGVILAELLGIPHATIVIEVDHASLTNQSADHPADEASAPLLPGGELNPATPPKTGGELSLRVKRELESGWYQWFTYQLPALLTIQSGISQIRYASLKGIMGAKKKEIRDITPTVEDFASAQKIEKVYLPLKTKQTQMLGNGDAKAGAIELVEKLRSELRVL